MNIDKHQQEILDAIVLGLTIEKMHYGDDYIELTPEQAMIGVGSYPYALRVKPGQREKLVRLYGRHDVYAPCFRFDAIAGIDDTHYIDYNPETGKIVGGRIEQLKAELGGE